MRAPIDSFVWFRYNLYRRKRSAVDDVEAIILHHHLNLHQNHGLKALWL